MFDIFTPHEVYLEYERRKALIHADCPPWLYIRCVTAIADELGIGVLAGDLTDGQATKQREAIARHGGRCDQ